MQRPSSRGFYDLDHPHLLRRGDPTSVAKYFVEEEVIHSKETRNAFQLRRSLTKFISTIAIAVFIEGLVIVFQVSQQVVERMLYPTALLATAILIVVGLGVYRRLSVEVERADKAGETQGGLD
jgi:uncharacterized membrane protein